MQPIVRLVWILLRHQKVQNNSIVEAPIPSPILYSQALGAKVFQQKVFTTWKYFLLVEAPIPAPSLDSPALGAKVFNPTKSIYSLEILFLVDAPIPAPSLVPRLLVQKFFQQKV